MRFYYHLGIVQYPVETDLAAHKDGLMKQLLSEIDQRKHSPRKRSLSPRQLADRD